tara:strand:+ start:1472 stop:2689 length:1218 start_codon:yes stop_codon:yes gene_type:complete
MKNILLIGQMTDVSGYGNAVRCYFRNLIDLHNNSKIKLSVLNFSFESEIKISSSELDLLKKFSVTEELNIKRGQYSAGDIKKINKFLEKDYEVVFFLLNDWLSDDGGINLNKICKRSKGVYPCVVWETNSIPAVWQKAYKTIKVKKMICACDWNKDTFKSIAPCSVIPYSVEFEKDYDENYYNKIKKITNDSFVFSSIFQWDDRKGIEKMILAYYLAFYDNPKVVLILKTYRSKTLSGQNETQWISTEIKKIISKIKHNGQPIQPQCKIIILNDIMNKKEINSIYKASDAYYTCSRGEGFGLPIAEAINYDTICITPDKGGHLDFIDKENNFLIKSEFEPVLSYDNPYWSSLENNWVEVSINSAKEKLLECYNSDLKEKVKKSKEFMFSVLSHEKCTNKMEEVLR